MKKVTKQNVSIGMVGTLAILSLILSLGISPVATNIYYGTNGINITCQPMKCDKLSNPNSYGLQTRCYFFSNSLNRTTYKSCKVGWINFKPEKNQTIVKKTFINNTTLNQTFINKTIIKKTFINQTNYVKSKGNPIYLLCKRKNILVSNCQIINQNSSVIKVGL